MGRWTYICINTRHRTYIYIVSLRIDHWQQLVKRHGAKIAWKEFIIAHGILTTLSTNILPVLMFILTSGTVIICPWKRNRTPLRYIIYLQIYITDFLWSGECMYTSNKVAWSTFLRYIELSIYKILIDRGNI